MSYITTYQKNKINPLDAMNEEIVIEDIAHALSLLCRANGHFPFFYSVAQHSINCFDEACKRNYSKRVQLACLLHDASEAYLSDITRPIKPLLKEYLIIEEKLQNQIFDKWIIPSLTEEEKKQVFAIDDAILYHEFQCLMGETIFEHELEIVSHPVFEFMDFEKVEQNFLRIFNYLIGKDIEKRYVGVDWMSGKWIAAILKNGEASIQVFSDIKDLCARCADVEEILIDCPIGLPEKVEEARRRPDVLARKYLKVKNRKSSIFNIPFRQMVYAEKKEDAWKINYELDAKISPQGFGIFTCIKQVDEFLLKNEEWIEKLIESHPECAFQSINGNQGIQFSKHTEEGLKERMQILSKYVWNIEEVLKCVKSKQREDVLDALALAVISQIGIRFIGTENAKDSKGLPMRIAIAEK